MEGHVDLGKVEPLKYGSCIALIPDELDRVGYWISFHLQVLLHPVLCLNPKLRYDRALVWPTVGDSRSRWRCIGEEGGFHGNSGLSNALIVLSLFVLVNVWRLMNAEPRGRDHTGNLISR